MKNEICCIYIIKNILNNKFYLGSTISFNKRKQTHLNNLLKNKHHSRYLQNAYNLYGKDNFVIEIFQYTTKDQRLELEQYYLDLYRPKYNVSINAYCPMQGRKHKPETIEKFKKREQPKGELSHNWGRKHSEEFRENKRLARLGYKHKLETIEKMRNTSKKVNSISRIDRTKSYKPVIDSDGNYHINMVECAKFWEISVQTVCDILKGRHFKTRKGISFKYV